jgi:alpha-D-xyloside xylohydrolase
VAPVLSAVTERAVYLPEGNWIDYWSGARLTGRRTITAAAPLDRVPLYVRAGAILPKIPDDVMTLVPQSEYKDQAVQSLDNRRVYEIYPGAQLRSITDFEGRTIAPGPEPGTLVVTGEAARVTVRWRFSGPAAVSVNGQNIDTVKAADGSVSVQLDHKGTSRLRWR